MATGSSTWIQHLAKASCYLKGPNSVLDPLIAL
jgi:hypothetical protein